MIKGRFHIVVFLIALFLPYLSQGEKAREENYAQEEYLLQRISQLQAGHLMELMLWADPEATNYSVESALNIIDEHLIELGRFNKIKKERKRLEKVFYYTQKKLLRQYATKSSLHDLLITGDYDCVSGTAIMAYIYRKLGYQVEIIELDFHVYARVVGENTYLIESTDRAFGFAWSKQRIKEIEENYRATSNDEVLSSASAPVGSSIPAQGTFEIDQLIGLKELVAIQYFNLALDAFENQDYLLAFNTLDKGILIYHNKRKEAFMEMIISEILSNEKISQQVKNDYLKKYVDKMRTKSSSNQKSK